MRCPFCGCIDTQVKDSRPNDDYSCIRRRRVCPECGSRFTTLERVQLRELVVQKRNDEQVPFDREKLSRSIQVAVRKRNIDAVRVDKIVSGIVRHLESLGEPIIKSNDIGKLVMESLLELDKVAYIRYASVYKNFASTQDFEEFVSQLIESKQDDKKE